MGDHKRWYPNYCIALFFNSYSHNQWHLLWRHLQTVSYSHSPEASTTHLQKTRQHNTSLMCYIQWSIENKTATTWTAGHTIFIISIHSYILNVMLLEMSPQPTHSMRHHKHFVTKQQLQVLQQITTPAPSSSCSQTLRTVQLRTVLPWLTTSISISCIWKCRIMVHIRPRIRLGLPSTISSAPIFSSRN
jgi:hypothetical protein